MKDYYNTLGVPRNARIEDIKRMYRRLALQFHPDRNPSPEAETMFKEINEAYEMLGDPRTRVIYDQILSGEQPPVYETTQYHRDPHYQPKPPEYNARKAQREEYIELITGYLKYALMASRLSLVFAIVLITDFSIPPTKSVHGIINKTVVDNSVILKNREVDGEKFPLELNDEIAKRFNNGTKVFIYRSAIFSVPLYLESEDSKVKSALPISIFGVFIFVPFMLLITSLLGTFYWKSIEFRFNLGVVNLILSALTFLFLNIHHLHLRTGK